MCMPIFYIHFIIIRVGPHHCPLQSNHPNIRITFFFFTQHNTFENTLFFLYVHFTPVGRRSLFTYTNTALTIYACIIFIKIYYAFYFTVF